MNVYEHDDRVMRCDVLTLAGGVRDGAPTAVVVTPGYDHAAVVALLGRPGARRPATGPAPRYEHAAGVRKRPSEEEEEEEEEQERWK